MKFNAHERDDRIDWVDAPYSKYLVEQLKKNELRTAVRALMAACKDSTDIHVRDAYHDMEAVKATLRLLGSNVGGIDDG